MKELTQAGIDAWNERTDEVIGFGEPWSEEKRDEYNREHPAPTEKEIWDFLEKYEA